VLAPVKNTTCRVEIFYHVPGVIKRRVYLWTENGFQEKQLLEAIGWRTEGNDDTIFFLTGIIEFFAACKGLQAQWQESNFQRLG
jgi:hypothetical protein